MTSKNSSSAEFKISIKEMHRHRKWPIALIALFYFISCIVVPLMSKSNYAGPDWNGVFTPFVRPSGAAFLAFFSGLILAFEGFFYLHNKKMLDFYESEPYKRGDRFAAVCGSSLIIFTVISAVLFFAGALLTGIGIPASTGIAAGVFKGYLLVWSLAAAGFALGALSVMLTGNIIVAILAAAVLSGYEFAARLITDELRWAFISTGYRTSFGTYSRLYYTAPLFNSMNNGADGRTILINFIYAAVVMGLALWAFSRRKNDSAGTAVVFTPVRHIIKIALGLLVFYCAFLIGRYDENRNAQGIIVGLIFTVIICMVMEIIYDFNVMSFKKHLAEDGILLLACLLSIAGMSAAGRRYDSYLPKAEEVASCAMMPDNNNIYYDESGSAKNNGEYAQEYMFLKDTKDVQDVLKIAENGIETTRHRQYGVQIDYAEYVDNGQRPVIIIWRLKNGRTATRSYTVDCKKVRQELNAVTQTEEFREGFFQIYHDKPVQDNADNKRWEVEYDTIDLTDSRYKSLDEVYRGFREAYLKDIKKWNYDFSTKAGLDGTLCARAPEGEVLDEEMEIYDDRYLTYQYLVYHDFTNTVDFLKSVGLYTAVETPQADGIFGISE